MQKTSRVLLEIFYFLKSANDYFSRFYVRNKLCRKEILSMGAQFINARLVMKNIPHVSEQVMNTVICCDTKESLDI